MTEPAPIHDEDLPLARPVHRLLAAGADAGLVGAAAVVGTLLAVLAAASGTELGHRVSVQIALVSLPIVGLAVVQAFLLTRDGQTVGKRWVDIRIVDLRGAPPGFIRAVVLRSVFNQLVSRLVCVYGVVDPALLLANKRRRAVHDFIAGTMVFDGPPGPDTPRVVLPDDPLA